jgi:hypothetical protein
LAHKPRFSRKLVSFQLPRTGQYSVAVDTDNGPEFMAHAANARCRFNSATSLFIDPGWPWQNARSLRSQDVESPQFEG